MAEPRTLCDFFFANVDARSYADALSVRRAGAWERIPTAEVSRAVEEVAMGLRALGLERGEKIALLSENRPEWLMVDYAALCLGAVSVPLYPTLNPRDTAYIVRDSEAVAAVASTPELAQKLNLQRSEMPSVRHWILADAPPGGVEGFTPLDEVRALGREAVAEGPGMFRRIAAEAEPDDLASIVYTSGTTGVPKGVMLSHGNFVQNALAALEVIRILEADRSLSLLPLSHALQRMADFALFYRGVRLGYIESLEHLGEALPEFRPTVLVAVPRIFEKAYGKLLDAAAKGPYLKKVLVHWSVRTCRAWALATLEGGGAGAWLSVRRALADALVGTKLRKKLGGALRLVISGGAPLSRELGLFFYGAGIPITEGYGLTESAPIIAANRPESPRYGSIGKPISNVEVKIAEDGELLARGPNVMRGYYHLPEATAEALTGDGWLRTGDIVCRDEEGYLHITDRKKELLVTAGGKKVAPQPIENLLKQNKYVNQAFLVGDGRPYCVALIVPNWENVLAYARRKGVAEEDREALCEHPQVRHLFENVLNRANANLSRFEQVKRCRLLPREFTPEDGELTPTLKFKRRVILAHRGELVESMYAEGLPPSEEP